MPPLQLTTPVAHPGLTASQLPWLSAAQHKFVLSHLGQIALFLVITRDHEGNGHVQLGEDGRPEVVYWPSAHDQHTMLKGQLMALRALAAAGAKVVGTSIQREDLYKCETKDKQTFEEFLTRIGTCGGFGSLGFHSAGVYVHVCIHVYFSPL